ncbi:MAG: hypothetical protein FWC69_01245 [Defluviitaleaceae bacterium]|nr:hypothetical protein [Defluviitaleaceae bacterium]
MKIKRLLLAGVASLMVVGAVGTAFAANSQTEGAYTPKEETPIENLRISWGLPYTEAGDTVISKEEATKIGMSALEEFFGADFSQLGEYTLEMGYQPGFNFRDSVLEINQEDVEQAIREGVDPAFLIRGLDCLPDDSFPIDVTRSLWVGSIILPTGRVPSADGFMLRSHDTFRFSVDVETGQIISLQFFPSEDLQYRPNMQSECMGSAIAVFEYRDNMTAEHEVEFAKHALQVVEDLDFFEGETTRAALVGGGWSLGRDRAFELVVSVAVECEDGELVLLTLQGRDRKELVGVSFNSRQVDHAVDREGNVVEPTSRLFGADKSEFNWVNR